MEIEKYLRVKNTDENLRDVEEYLDGVKRVYDDIDDDITYEIKFNKVMNNEDGEQELREWVTETKGISKVEEGLESKFEGGLTIQLYYSEEGEDEDTVDVDDVKKDIDGMLDYLGEYLRKLKNQ